MSLTQPLALVHIRRMKNFMAIHSVHSDEAAEDYRKYFKTVYSENLTHGEWAATSTGDFATAIQTWQGMKSDFYCTHFVAENEEQVYKQIEAWGITQFCSSIVFETERFTSAFMPADQKVDQHYFSR